MKISNHHFLAIGLVGAAIRILMWSAISPLVMYDDHYEPAQIIATSHQIPAPQDCFECFQPPFFYLITAAQYKVASLFSADPLIIKKFLQAITLLFGLLTIPLVNIFLRLLKLQNFSRLVIFALFCFLPRHIFMSASHSNDSAVYFLILASCILAIKFIQRNDKIYYGVLASVLAGLAVLTKSTAVILFPFLFLLAILFNESPFSNWKVTLKRVFIFLLLPSILFVGHLFWKSQYIGNPFKMNIEIMNYDIPQRPGKREIFTFEPWQYWGKPIIAQENSESLFTTVFAQFFFESEPKTTWIWFKDQKFVQEYQYYINLSHPQPDWSGLPAKYIVYGRISLLIGLGIGMLFMLGLVTFLRDSLRFKRRKTFGWPLLAMLIVNLMAIIALTSEYAMYSFMKAAFVLPSLPALLFFSAYGIEKTKQKKLLRTLAAGFILALVIFTLIFCLHISIDHFN